MSNFTSICGTPRGAGGMPSRLNWPSSRLSADISRSPWNTRTVTAVWLSSAVLKTCFRSAGIVVLRSTSLVITPPKVSMPRESGVTSSSRMSCTSPLRTPPWIAAPTATTSSGFTPLCGSLPLNSSLTTCCTLGMRVEPPTSTTSSILLGSSLASLRAWIHRAFYAVDQVVDELFEFRTRDRHLQVLRTTGIGRDERQVDVGALGRAQFLLGLFAGFLQTLQGHLIFAKIDALLALELLQRRG